jgi:hypothetical protein
MPSQFVNKELRMLGAKSQFRGWRVLHVWLPAAEPAAAQGAGGMLSTAASIRAMSSSRDSL